VRLRDAAALALSSLRGSAARTLLTILGLAVGVGAVLTVMALGASGETQVEAEIDRLGVNKIWITTADDTRALVAADAFLAQEACGAPVCAGASTIAVVTLGEMASPAQIAGYDAGMAAVHGGECVAGRLFNALDYAEARAICLVDEALAESLGGDVLGRRLSAGGRRLMIVGVVAGMPLQAMALGGGTLALPLSTWLDTFGGAVQQLTISVPAGENAGEISNLAMAGLGEEGLRAETLETEIDAARRIVRIFVLVLACVAAVCMLTGGIGVMNILLVSVRERRREIGLIKALGGTSAQVGLIFLLEAAAYAALGGLLGLLLGGLLIRLFGGMIGLSAQLTLQAAIPVLAAAALLGVAFGVAPAVRAAGLEPVEALRSE